MKKIHKLTSLIIFCYATALAFDPSSFSVPLHNFTEDIYSQRKSLYSVYSGTDSFSLPDTPFQKIIKNTTGGDGKSILIKSGDFSNERRNSKNNTGYTENTRFLTIDSPGIRALLRKLPKSGDPVRNTENFVYRYIEKKTLGIPLLPAENIVKSRSGDCTEHTILAVSLLRAQGIPARALVGMILVPFFRGEKNAFVYHMWAEAYYHDKWHMVDATRPGKQHPNRYIAFAYHSLKTSMPISYFRAISTIEKMKVEYIATP